MPYQDRLIVRGAREHNLKNIDIDIPRDKLVVFTGLSGSGKSSLAFDTIFAEGQRRYVESLSAYARQFLGQMDKPDLDAIEGLSPAISIDQKGTSRNPRSTVGTVTEIYDYLRLLFARTGHPHCPKCGRPIERQSVQQMAQQILDFEDGTRLMLLAPVIRDRKGEHAGVFDEIRRQGFVRLRVDGAIVNIDDPIKLAKTKKHTIEVVVDRIVVRHEHPDEDEHPERVRIIESLETCLRIGEGLAIANKVDPEGPGEDILFSESYACPYDGFSFGEIEPRTFSFNNPHGACPACTGLGTTMVFEPDLVIPNHDLTLNEGAIRPWQTVGQDSQRWFGGVLEAAAEKFGFRLDVPVRELSTEHLDLILNGTKEQVTVKYTSASGRSKTYNVTFEGVIPNLKRRYQGTSSDWVREEIERYMAARPCPTCNGARLKPEVLAVTVGGRSIIDYTQGPVHELQAIFADLADGVALSRVGVKTPKGIANPQLTDADMTLSNREAIIARQILKEIRDRVGFLVDVGLNYLTLDRSANTLSGGEAQRIRLATQIGSSLMGVLYILDEPSIGLHQRDNAKLIKTLERLRDIGNTLIVVEHDEDTMRAADWILDIGPGAGEHGGHVVANGTYEQVLATPESLTGQFLSGRRQIATPERRRTGNGHKLRVRKASGNNLRDVTVDFPLGTFTCVTGVSGSGKSTLVTDTLYKRLAQDLHGAKALPDKHAGIDGIEHVDKIIEIDQSPIGRTPRSNPATYTGVFTPIRELYAAMPEAKARGYQPGRFSFNVKGGRCEACKGEGVIQIEMNFLPDVYVPCEVCEGRRYNREALEILYKGRSISDVLELTVTEAVDFFANVPAVANKMRTLEDVGLGYIRLGQPATQLSGGEAQRVKLASELSKRATGKTVYILDEPTTGLHFADIERLLGVLQRLADGGNTIIVIEHNLDVIKSADWLIDLGPEGGSGGGQIIAEGTPETIAETDHSWTGQFLRRLLEPQAIAAD
ncbi:MAG TPA: excinuclease ABC subunit UvrA [Thermomicrobiales bacterium]|jgi:excinuclease ABC subunit A|nr:excinuclease ABC subunit UvrA [Thermomicrobiales bacterium]